MLKKINRIAGILYLFFGALTTLVNIISYTILAKLIHIDYLVSNVIAWILSVLFAYVTNRKFVFESKEKNKFKELSKFVASRFTTLILDMLIMFVGVTCLNGNDKIIKLISQVLVIIGNYVFSKIFIFKKKK